MADNQPNQTRKKRAHHGAAAPAGVCADGIGAVPHALFLQSAATGSEDQAAAAATSQTTPAGDESQSPRQAAPQAAHACCRPQPVPGQIEASTEQQFVIDTDIYHVTLSNRGGTVRSWILKKYRDKQGKPLELVNAGELFQSGAAVFHRSAGRQSGRRVELRALRRQALGQRLGDRVRVLGR